jgi:hypothetical protein
MNIKNYADEAYQTMVEKGFFDCPECDGHKLLHGAVVCPECEGTGINKNKNIGEQLMLIITELSEALEADRKNHYANLTAFDAGLKMGYPFDRTFEDWIKNTFEDEIADVFIRFFTFIGYYDLNVLIIESNIIENKFFYNYDNIGEFFFNFITHNVIMEKLYYATRKRKIEIMSESVGIALAVLIDFCNRRKIDIEKHIQLKMQYNKLRPKKHGGKKY